MEKRNTNKGAKLVAAILCGLSTLVCAADAVMDLIYKAQQFRLYIHIALAATWLVAFVINLIRYKRAKAAANAD